MESDAGEKGSKEEGVGGADGKEEEKIGYHIYMINLCIFGDSITWGAWLPFRVGWANLLRNYLEKTSDNAISVYDLGIDGDTSRYILRRFEVESRARKPDVLLFAVGTNDSGFRVSKDKPLVPIAEFDNNLRKLIGMAREFTNKIVFVGLAKGDDTPTNPLPQSTTGKCYDKENARLYDEVIRKVCDEEGLVYVTVMDKLTDEDFLDGLHPNPDGHLKIYESVRKVLDKILQLSPNQYYVLVDKNDEAIGFKESEHIHDGDIVRVSALWVTNSRGEVLITKRHHNKRRDPSRWGPAAAAILEKGWSYRDGVMKAASNELGLEKIEPAEHVKLFMTGMREFYCQWYRLKIDLMTEEFEYNRDEIEDLKWIGMDELVEQVVAKPYLYVQSFERYCREMSGNFVVRQ